MAAGGGPEPRELPGCSIRRLWLPDFPLRNYGPGQPSLSLPARELKRASVHNVLLTRRKSSSGHDGWGQEVAITANPSPFPGRHFPSSEDSQDWAHRDTRERARRRGQQENIGGGWPAASASDGV